MALPGMSDANAAIYRNALDGGGLAQATKSKLSVHPVAGKELAVFVKQIFSVSARTIKKMRAEIKPAQEVSVKRKSRR